MFIGRAGHQRTGWPSGGRARSRAKAAGAELDGQRHVAERAWPAEQPVLAGRRQPPLSMDIAIVPLAATGRSGPSTADPPLCGDVD